MPSYLLPEYLPDGFVFTDPSHLTGDHVKELLDHWYDWQSSGLRVL
jgi:hypothetical protein